MDDHALAHTADEFHGEITVSSVIIDQLSSGLYESPAACLKELVNNSFDADANHVYMSVRPDADLIVIDDDGTGMSRAEFERHFRRIARSYKREGSDITATGRKKIGKIGIGFIAANEICDRLEIQSSKAGSTERLQVTLDFAEMRRDVDQRTRGNGEVAKADYAGAVFYDEPIDSHYTRIFMSEVRGESREILSGARAGGGTESLYGLSATSVFERLADRTLRTWDEFDLYSKTILEIGENVPVPYFPEWAGEYSADLADISEAIEALNFSVRVDGTDLYKPIVFPPSERTLLKRFEISGEHVGAFGYMYANGGRLTPTDLNGVLIRIRNSAVGDYDSSFLAYPGFLSALFQGWVSVELYADDRLEDALNIDRRTLRVTHPAYVELQDLFHSELESFFSNVRRDLYGARSAGRKLELAEKQTRSIEEAAGDKTKPSETVPILHRRSLPDVVNEVQAKPLDSKTVRVLNKTRSISEIVELVRLSALEVGISEADLDALLARLLERLTR